MEPPYASWFGATTTGGSYYPVAGSSAYPVQPVYVQPTYSLPEPQAQQAEEPPPESPLEWLDRRVNEVCNRVPLGALT